MPNLYIGLMSGTSVDSIDAVLVEFNEEGKSSSPHILTTLSHPIAPPLREDILALCTPGPAELDRAGQLDRQLGQVFADAANTLLSHAGVKSSDVTAIGSHGQTVRHRPPGTVTSPFSLQLGDPNSIAALTGITTVADFRRRDIALGGHGAPLIPAFHHAVFATDHNRAVINIGGMGNITELAADGSVNGYDTGPGNVLLDYWIGLHQGAPYDRDGAWAASGQVHSELFKRLMADPYFAAKPPKSTGREAFNASWLEQACSGLEVSPVDVQATLAEVTAASIADAVRQFADSGDVLVCGGGAKNKDLLSRLRRRMPDWSVSPTDNHGIDADWVEAVGFAWLARQTLLGLPGNCPSVTGAQKESVLGAIYPA
ncbi:anhydro-N-acetylmuramic acid kinase [Microbulbifer thermotolerans]|uniref:anhydro-N-acetylmuramic acid kinase n=1 Tax=Microbulbifer thermotolerans TaxID=252514 RepID=UPI00224B52B9|nr:anhydro-N-acetylmuramic acid kinase [Microbulbifer thermotolerans]MCX2784165.1 anhydro-N-acetylmuramic acid kinase [Microbulbifer thermotolerans]